MSIAYRNSAAQQTGHVLMTVLVFLVVFSLLGMSALTTTQLEMHGVRNWQDSSLEFAAAEAALQKAEQQLSDKHPPNCLRMGFLMKGLDESPWQRLPSCKGPYPNPLISVHYVVEKNPKSICFISNNGPMTEGFYYRVTALAGRGQELPTLLQTTYLQLTVKPCLEPVKTDYLIKEGQLSWCQLI